MMPEKMYTPEEARLLSPLQLALIGDSVHSLIVREALLRRGLRVQDMHRTAASTVSAVSQSKAMAAILPLLTEAEADIARRGRNAHSHHAAPKSATTAEYSGATALETLLGYLYLTGQSARIRDFYPYILPEDIQNARKNA